jgi:hypothetical protein
VQEEIMCSIVSPSVPYQYDYSSDFPKTEILWDGDFKIKKAFLEIASGANLPITTLFTQQIKT